MSCVKDLEARLCRLLDRAYCVYVAGATSGIALALQAAGIRNRDVALPAGVCVNVPLAVMYSGNKPLYLDQESATLGLSADALLSSHRVVAGVIAVHAYGNPCSMPRIADICRTRGSFLIEDLAPALGATIDGCPVGKFGDAAVLSFGAGKIIDVGGGGAVLTDDASLAREVSSLAMGLPDPGPDLEVVDEFSRWHTQIYNERYGNDLNSRAPVFLKKAMALKHGFVHQADPTYAARALDRLAHLPKELEQRYANWHRLAEQFDKVAIPGLAIQRPVLGAAPWRLNAFVSSGRDDLLRQLLRNKLKASSWFPPSDLFLVPGRGDGDAQTPVASRIGREILNLWINQEVDCSYPRAVIRVLQAHTLS